MAQRGPYTLKTFIVWQHRLSLPHYGSNKVSCAPIVWLDWTVQSIWCFGAMKKFGSDLKCQSLTSFHALNSQELRARFPEFRAQWSFGHDHWNLCSDHQWFGPLLFWFVFIVQQTACGSKRQRILEEPGAMICGGSPSQNNLLSLTTTHSKTKWPPCRPKHTTGKVSVTTNALGKTRLSSWVGPWPIKWNFSRFDTQMFGLHAFIDSIMQYFHSSSVQLNPSPMSAASQLHQNANLSATCFTKCQSWQHAAPCLQRTVAGKWWRNFRLDYLIHVFRSDPNTSRSRSLTKQVVPFCVKECLSWSAHVQFLKARREEETHDFETSSHWNLFSSRREREEFVLVSGLLNVNQTNDAWCTSAFWEYRYLSAFCLCFIELSSIIHKNEQDTFLMFSVRGATNTFV